jgi:hypothetical protein
MPREALYESHLRRGFVRLNAGKRGDTYDIRLADAAATIEPLEPDFDAWWGIKPDEIAYYPDRKKSGTHSIVILAVVQAASDAYASWIVSLAHSLCDVGLLRHFLLVAPSAATCARLRRRGLPAANCVVYPPAVVAWSRTAEVSTHVVISKVRSTSMHVMTL